MSLEDALKDAQKAAQKTAKMQRISWHKERRDRAKAMKAFVKTWIAENLKDVLREQAGRTEIVLDPMSCSHGFSDRYAEALKAAIEKHLLDARVTGSVKVEVRPTCGPGDDHFRREKHVIINLF